MKCALVFCALVAVTVAREYYDAKYDNFDVKALAENDRLLDAYVKCFTSEGPCTSEGKDLKRIFTEALKTKCAKCSEMQKERAHVILKHLQDKFPQKLDLILNKIDPEGQGREDLKNFIKV